MHPVAVLDEVEELHNASGGLFSGGGVCDHGAVVDGRPVAADEHIFKVEPRDGLGLGRGVVLVLSKRHVTAAVVGDKAAVIIAVSPGGPGVGALVPRVKVLQDRLLDLLA